MTERSSAYFRQVAGDWDNIRAGYFGEGVRSTAIAKAYLRPEMVVADIGSGTGFIAAGLAPLVRRVYVVDGSPDMLEVARRNLSAFTNIEYHQADGLSLPFPEESLDAVFANMYLHHCPDPLAAIREMVRVLRPGGRLVITDMDEHPHAWLKAEMADVWQGFARDAVRGWLKEAGLVNTIVDCTGQSCCAESSTQAQVSSCCGGSTKAKAEISVFVATGTRRMAMREAVEQTYSAYAQGGTCGCSTMPAVSEGKSAAAPSCCGGETAQQSTAGQGVSATSSSSCGGSTTSSGSCCGSASASEIEIKPGYSSDELASAPSEAAEIPLGCGNPVAIANLKPGETVLDIGSGGGLDAFLSANKVGPSGRVIGVDMTPAMLERARAAAERNGFNNVEFRQGFAEALPATDGEVDVIISNCVINLTEDKGQVFREAFRVLRPGGRLEVSDVVAGGPLPIDLRESAEGWAECVTGALPEQEYLDLVKQAGFTAISVRRSPADGTAAGVPVYSAIVSASKPA